MTQATVNVTGCGYVAIDTTLSEIVLVGALTISGDPVNCKKKKVFRNKKKAPSAQDVYLIEIKPGHFMLKTDDYLYETRN